MKNFILYILFILCLTGCCRNILVIKEKEDVIKKQEQEIITLKKVIAKERLETFIRLKKMETKLMECWYDNI